MVYAKEMRIKPVSHALMYKNRFFEREQRSFWRGPLATEKRNKTGLGNQPKRTRIQCSGYTSREKAGCRKAVFKQNKNLYAMSLKNRPNQTPEKRFDGGVCYNKSRREAAGSRPPEKRYIGREGSLSNGLLLRWGRGRKLESQTH